MTSLYLSDLHIDGTDDRRLETLAALLAVEARRVDAIYILGDLCEVWIGDDDDSEFADAFRALLLATSRDVIVRIMRGNRDFLFGETFAAQCGCELIDDPYRSNPRTLLAHGDTFCVDDHEYQQLRTVLRSPAWQQEVLSRSLRERRELAATMRAESARTNANKAENIMDVAPAEVERVAGRYGANRIIHGHTHRPGVHRYEWGTRYVLGAWERCGWLLRETEASAQLECFPLTGRYET